VDLHTIYPYGLLRHGIINSYPSLDANIHTEVTVIGAGINGALVARELCKAGYKVIVVDRRHVGMGSTAASTSLLQYEIDVPLRELINKIGEKKAVRSYLLCRDAIYKLRDICAELNHHDLFALRSSFQFASFRKDVTGLKTEYLLRKKTGLAVTWFTAEEVAKKYGFKKPAGIYSADGAEADAYLLTHRLLESCIGAGGKIFDHTEVQAMDLQKKKCVLITTDGKKIFTRFLVIACGYESQKYLPKKIAKLSSTYAIVSEPFRQNKFWYKNSLIWETATPYLYLRTTQDNRIMIGGKDIESSDPGKRDSLLPSKAKALLTAFRKLLPSIDFKTDFKWAGTFSSSRDGLPLIGSVPGQPTVCYAIGFGGNGTTFSVIAAELIRDQLKGRKNPDAGIFSFERF
jgi:glycine/D-amino acid oxidase-like deaminating enzyme